jgi:hypothetical protein
MDWELLDTVRRDAHFAALIVAALIAPAARAAVIVSSDATQNMTCSDAVCEPTASDAVLNASDLETLLASGSLTVTTTGDGVEAGDLVISAPVSWTASNALTLEAGHSLKIDKPVSVNGLSGRSLAINSDGGSLSFGKKGNVTFANLASQLTIDGNPYTLVGDIKKLAADVASKPSGDFALANTYDARQHGKYGSAPIAGVFSGVFEGLGNTISNLTIDDKKQSDLYVGLFAQLMTQGDVVAQLRDIGLVNVKITAVAGQHLGNAIGSLVSINSGGVIEGCYATGTVTGKGGGGGNVIGGLAAANGTNDAALRGQISGSYSTVTVIVDSRGASDAGGLVAQNTGIISRSYATGSVTGGDDVTAGGFAGTNAIGGQIKDSFATGAVIVGGGLGAGGLVGYYLGKYKKSGGKRLIVNSYATGAVSGGSNVNVGGLLGISIRGITENSYSTGAVTGGSGSSVGGLVGYDDYGLSKFTKTYWDADTSGITNLSQGAGNISNAPGITGLSTEQFQTGLPQGFDPKVWAEEPNINGGLPYLLANPPPKHE